MESFAVILILLLLVGLAFEFVNFIEIHEDLNWCKGWEIRLALKSMRWKCLYNLIVQAFFLIFLAVLATMKEG